MATLPSVLMFGWEFPPFNSGGLGVACEGLSKALSASGVPLTFVLPLKIPISASWCRFVFANETDAVMTKEQISKLFAGYQSHAVESVCLDEYGIPSRVSASISGSLVQRVKAYAEKAPGIAKKHDHSIIHAHDWLTYPAGIAAKETTKRPLVAHIHATEFDRSGSDNVNKEIFNIEREGFRKADMVVAVSGRTRDKVIQKYGISPDKVKVVHNGVEFPEGNPDLPKDLEVLKRYGNSIVLFAGRITLQKGPDYFVALAEKVLQFEPKTFFVVSGSGDMEGEMIREVAKRGLTQNFIFCGFLRGAELQKVFRAADLFVMPSVSEPFGIVPLEAMLSDAPVLISKESGVSEILSTALKSHFWDIDDMTDKVVAILRSKKLKSHLQINGKREAKTIHWGNAARSLINIYNDLAPYLEPTLKIA
ncbi:MAG TPA: glycosyltransferase family 4 protein [Candidatus Paceibacterota bacterium]